MEVVWWLGDLFVERALLFGWTLVASWLKPWFEDWFSACIVVYPRVTFRLLEATSSIVWWLESTVVILRLLGTAVDITLRLLNSTVGIFRLLDATWRILRMLNATVDIRRLYNLPVDGRFLQFGILHPVLEEICHVEIIDLPKTGIHPLVWDILILLNLWPLLQTGIPQTTPEHRGLPVLPLTVKNTGIMVWFNSAHSRFFPRTGL